MGGPVVLQKVISIEKVGKVRVYSNGGWACRVTTRNKVCNPLMINCDIFSERKISGKMNYLDPAATAKRMSGNGNNEDLRSVIKVIIFLLGQSSKRNSS